MGDGDIHVYDPVYGVIPLETLELWKKQEEESQERRLLSIQNGKNRILPPVIAYDHSHDPFLTTNTLTH